MREPEYYASNGLSPIGAMKQGLISQEEYIGFLKGNIIKYVIRAGKKEDAVKDLKKAKDYINFYMDIFQMTPEEQAELNKELINTDHTIDGEPTITIDVDNDIDFERLAEDMKESLLLENQVITESPTDDPNIMKLNLSDIMYDENGDLKPEARAKIRRYLLNREVE